MCRSTEDPRFYRNSSSSSSSSSSSRRFRRRNRLDIKTFSLRFSILDIPSSSPTTTTNNKGSPSPSPPKVNPLPGSLTLHYLPRISGSPLDINDSPIPSDSPAFVTLHQVMNCHSHSPSPLGDDSESIRRRQVVVFASRERISASEGVQFEVYWREEKVLKGVFRRNEEDEFINIVDFPIGAAGDWTVDCRCTLESHPSLSLGLGFLEVSHAQVCIEIDGHGMSRGGVISSDKVDMAEGMRRRNKTKKSSKKKKNKSKSKSRGFVVLEEIPEEREVDDDSDDSSSSSSCTSCCCGGDPESELRTVGGVGGAGDGEEEKKQGQGLEMEIEGVRWAVDVGIWVMCLGVGYLVTRASSTTFPRRRRPFFF